MKHATIKSPVIQQDSFLNTTLYFLGASVAWVGK